MTMPGLPRPSAADVAKAKELASDILKRADFRMRRARTLLTMNQKLVFWSTGALHLELVPTIFMPTMGVDGRHLYYNPITVASPLWDDDELIYIVAHETAHCMHGDVWRRNEREPQRWNIACDRRVNPELDEVGLKRPKGALGTKADLGVAAERLYLDITDDEVAKAFGGPQGGEGNDCGGTGTFYDDAGMSPDGTDSPSPGDTAAEWDLITRQAAYMAKAQGHLPASFEHLLEPKRPSLDPRTLIRHFMSMSNRDDYTWSRPNRRFVGSGLYLPALRSESVGPVFIGIDTSGSVSDDECSRMLGFVDAVACDVQPDCIYLVQCDAAVQHSCMYTKGERLPKSVTIHGRGGTNMRPLWAWQRQHNVRPVCSIVLSDMEMDNASFGEPQSHPVLWISTTNGAVAPFGTTVYLGDK